MSLPPHPTVVSTTTTTGSPTSPIVYLPLKNKQPNPRSETLNPETLTTDLARGRWSPDLSLEVTGSARIVGGDLGNYGSEIEKDEVGGGQEEDKACGR